MTDSTLDTQLEETTETGTPNIPDHTATPYTPVFNDTVRTVIYVVTLVASDTTAPPPAVTLDGGAVFAYLRFHGRKIEIQSGDSLSFAVLPLITKQQKPDGILPR